MRLPLFKTELKKRSKKIQPLTRGFEYLGDPVFITDENANILYANAAAERASEMSRDDMLGRNPGDLWGGNMPREFYQDMWRQIKIEKRPFSGEVRNKRGDREYWQEIHISPILSEAGSVEYFIGIQPLITEKKEKERFRDEFISILGHQLKNPLATMKLALEWMLLERGTLPKDAREGLESVYESNEALIGIINDLTAFARAEKNQTNAERVDLAREIERSIRHTRKRIPGVRIRASLLERPSVAANSTLASQVFQNLIDNAAEYAAPEDGTVDIELKESGGSYLCTVVNNGTSIPKNEQRKIFSPFFRASNARDAKQSGTGLGLFIVKSICTSLGWDVWFESPPKGTSEGTAFFIRIPN